MKQKVKRRILKALLISIGAHFVFLIWSAFVNILPHSILMEESSQIFKVKMIADEESSLTQNNSPTVDPIEKFTPQPENPMTTPDELKFLTEKSLSTVDQVLVQVSKKSEPLVLAEMPKIDDQKDSLIKEKQGQSMIKRSTRKNLVELGRLPSLDGPTSVPVIVSGQNQGGQFLDKNIHITQNRVFKGSPSIAVTSVNDVEVMKKTPSGMRQKSSVKELGAILTYELFKYRNETTNEQYFKLIVKVKDATVDFPVLPKEIVFLVDASNSIGEERLAQFKEGVYYALTHLNPSDFFNVIVFKDETIPLSATSLEANAMNVEQARHFFNDLKAGSKTDVYGAIQSTLNLKNSFKPSYRVLLTDGFPTTGITNARQVINETSVENDSQVSFFTLGGGVNVSSYMMEFLAYKNRGWAQITDRDYLIAQEFFKLIDRIKDPLLLNLRYRMNGVNEKEIYPKILPDFFKGSEFVVYGKYENENNFFVQLLGDIPGETKEFVMQASLADAKDTDQDIARQWAFHKVYHLIGELKYDENNYALIKEIDFLCEKFNIVTPYSRNFRESIKDKSSSKLLPDSLSFRSPKESERILVY